MHRQLAWPSLTRTSPIASSTVSRCARLVCFESFSSKLRVATADGGRRHGHNYNRLGGSRGGSRRVNNRNRGRVTVGANTTDVWRSRQGLQCRRRVVHNARRDVDDAWRHRRCQRRTDRDLCGNVCDSLGDRLRFQLSSWLDGLAFQLSRRRDSLIRWLLIGAVVVWPSKMYELKAMIMMIRTRANDRVQITINEREVIQQPKQGYLTQW